MLFGNTEEHVHAINDITSSDLMNISFNMIQHCGKEEWSGKYEYMMKKQIAYKKLSNNHSNVMGKGKIKIFHMWSKYVKKWIPL